MSLIYFNNVVYSEIPEFFDEGLYRVIAISPQENVAALYELPSVTVTGMSTKVHTQGMHNIKKIPISVLDEYEKKGLIRQVELRHRFSPVEVADKLYSLRLRMMERFMLHKNIASAIFSNQGLGRLVHGVVNEFNCSRPVVYKYFYLLCVFGFSGPSLNPQFHKCGAPGVLRPHDETRKKVGRKTSREKLGIPDENPQQGVTKDERLQITALYQTYKTPYLPDTKVYLKIIKKLYVKEYRHTSNGIEPILPKKGSYPTTRQFRYIIHSEIDKLSRLKMATTTGHFNRNHRGLHSHIYQDIDGPGHQYAIDSTVADVYLVSSINRAWICGRPVVYIVVDVWSSAIVGFHVCWTGPSWEMAKVALFSVAAGSEFISQAWGISKFLDLEIQPTLPHSFLADRGEYNSEASRETASNFGYGLDYNPSYRPDLKGLVEVLNRIAKDEQFAFLPGAMDAKRLELELKGKGKFEAVLTIQEYVSYLVNIFTFYNFSADRSYRLDAEMMAHDVIPTPVGLWKWGHEIGYGYRKKEPIPTLIKHLLPSEQAIANRNGLNFAGLNYEGSYSEREQLSAQARNFGAMSIPIKYFPGSTSKIWMFNKNSVFTQFDLSPHAKSKSTTFDEWRDAKQRNSLGRPDREALRVEFGIQAMHQNEKIIEAAKKATQQAQSISSDTQPSLDEVRALEVAAQKSIPSIIAPTDDIVSSSKIGVYDGYASQLIRKLTQKASK